MGLLNNCIKIIVVYNKENKGFPIAINQGLKFGSNYNLISNNDVYFYPQTINELLKAIKASKYGYITAVDKNRNWKIVKDIKNEWWEGLCNSCFIISREFINKVGYYDENFELGNDEDRDMLHRAGLLGKEARAYIPAIIEHEHGATQKTINSNSPERLFKNRKYMENKYGIKLGW